MIRSAAKNILSPFMIGLSDFIEAKPKCGYWLRPCNDLQSQQMVAAYLKALQPHLKNGGYIFVKRSRAADLFRQLTELGAPYKAVHFEVMEDIAGIIDINDPKALWVIVEDDSLPYATLTSRFQTAEITLRRKMAPALGTSINYDEMKREMEQRQAKGMVVLMFIELDYPSVKGFSIVQAQCRSLNIAACRVSRDSAHDHELNTLFGEPDHSKDEWKSRIANTLRIFGSGPKHHAEFMMTISDLAALADTEKDESDALPETFIVTKRLKKESSLGVALVDSGAYLVDLSQ